MRRSATQHPPQQINASSGVNTNTNNTEAEDVRHPSSRGVESTNPKRPGMYVAEAIPMKSGMVRSPRPVFVVGAGGVTSSQNSGSGGNRLIRSAGLTTPNAAATIHNNASPRVPISSSRETANQNFRTNNNPSHHEGEQNCNSDTEDHHQQQQNRHRFGPRDTDSFGSRDREDDFFRKERVSTSPSTKPIPNQTKYRPSSPGHVESAGASSGDGSVDRSVVGFGGGNKNTFSKTGNGRRRSIIPITPIPGVTRPRDRSPRMHPYSNIQTEEPFRSRQNANLVSMAGYPLRKFESNTNTTNRSTRVGVVPAGGTAIKLLIHSPTSSPIPNVGISSGRGQSGHASSNNNSESPNNGGNRLVVKRRNRDGDLAEDLDSHTLPLGLMSFFDGIRPPQRNIAIEESAGKKSAPGSSSPLNANAHSSSNSVTRSPRDPLKDYNKNNNNNNNNDYLSKSRHSSAEGRLGSPRNNYNQQSNNNSSTAKPYLTTASERQRDINERYGSDRTPTRINPSPTYIRPITGGSSYEKSSSASSSPRSQNVGRVSSTSAAQIQRSPRTTNSNSSSNSSLTNTNSKSTSVNKPFLSRRQGESNFEESQSRPRPTSIDNPQGSLNPTRKKELLRNQKKMTERLATGRTTALFRDIKSRIQATNANVAFASPTIITKDFTTAVMNNNQQKEKEILGDDFDYEEESATAVEVQEFPLHPYNTKASSSSHFHPVYFDDLTLKFDDCTRSRHSSDTNASLRSKTEVVDVSHSTPNIPINHDHIIPPPVPFTDTVIENIPLIREVENDNQPLGIVDSLENLPSKGDVVSSTSTTSTCKCSESQQSLEQGDKLSGTPSLDSVSRPRKCSKCKAYIKNQSKHVQKIKMLQRSNVNLESVIKQKRSLVEQLQQQVKVLMKENQALAKAMHNGQIAAVAGTSIDAARPNTNPRPKSNSLDETKSEDAENNDENNNFVDIALTGPGIVGLGFPIVGKSSTCPVNPMYSRSPDGAIAPNLSKMLSSITPTAALNLQPVTKLSSIYNLNPHRKVAVSPEHLKEAEDRINLLTENCDKLATDLRTRTIEYCKLHKFMSDLLFTLNGRGYESVTDVEGNVVDLNRCKGETCLNLKGKDTRQKPPVRRISGNDCMLKAVIGSQEKMIQNLIIQLETFHRDELLGDKLSSSRGDRQCDGEFSRIQATLEGEILQLMTLLEGACQRFPDVLAVLRDQHRLDMLENRTNIGNSPRIPPSGIVGKILDRCDERIRVGAPIPAYHFTTSYDHEIMGGHPNAKLEKHLPVGYNHMMSNGCVDFVVGNGFRTSGKSSSSSRAHRSTRDLRHPHGSRRSSHSEDQLGLSSKSESAKRNRAVRRPRSKRSDLQEEKCIQVQPGRSNSQPIISAEFTQLSSSDEEAVELKESGRSGSGPLDNQKNQSSCPASLPRHLSSHSEIQQQTMTAENNDQETGKHNPNRRKGRKIRSKSGIHEPAEGTIMADYCEDGVNCPYCDMIFMPAMSTADVNKHLETHEIEMEALDKESNME